MTTYYFRERSDCGRLYQSAKIEAEDLNNAKKIVMEKIFHDDAYIVIGTDIDGYTKKIPNICMLAVRRPKNSYRKFARWTTLNR